MTNERKEYLKNYYKANKEQRKANYEATKSPTKKQITMNKLIILLYLLAEKDAGKIFKIECLHRSLESGWSDILVTNQPYLAKFLNVSRQSISKYMVDLEHMNYVKYIDKGRLSTSKYDSNCYIVNLTKIYDDFSSMMFDIDLDKLRSDYYNGLVEDKSVIEYNNKCMKKYPKFFKDLCENIDILNTQYPEPYKVKFMIQNNDGNYKYGRYYSELCNTLNPEKHNSSTRLDIVKHIFGVDKDTKIISFDVSGMRLRSEYYILNDKPFPIDKDVYFEISKFILPQNMTEKEFRSSGARDIVKTESMSIEMKLNSIYYKQQMYKLDNLTNLNKHMNDYNIEKIESLFKMSYPEFLDRLKYGIYDFLKVYDFDKDKRVILGRLYFKFEASIYYHMNHICYNRNIKTVNTYDEFYFIDGIMTEEIFYNIYHEAIDNFKNDLKKYNINLVKEYGREFTPKYYIQKTKKITKKQISDDYIKSSTNLNTEEIDFYTELKNNKDLEKELVAQGKLIVY